MAKNWYPIIDNKKCIQCGNCISFCRHGVYNKASEKIPVIEKPGGCVQSCHGCGSKCPVGAITYFGDKTDWAPPNSQKTNKKENKKMENKKTVKIELMYLDTTVCERCQGTEQNFDKAVTKAKTALQKDGYQIETAKIHIDSLETAKKYQFYSSPTVRVNEIDILGEIKENNCESCGSLCNSVIDCRTFTYKGKNYDAAPADMIYDAIIATVKSGKPAGKAKAYKVPANLIQFFETKIDKGNKMKIEIFEKALCCETGVCGANVDPELLRITSVAAELKSKGISIERYNLSVRPEMFIKNALVSDYIKTKGIDNLPLTLVDGKIVKEKAYLSNKEIEKITGIKIGEKPKGGNNSGCGCGSGCNCH